MKTPDTTNPAWRVHTPNLLKEVLTNPACAILRQPLNIFGKLLCELGERAVALDDPTLNILMLRLTIYDQADATKHGQDEINAAFKREQDRLEKASWEGLDCGCGGGSKVGHAVGCPEEAEQNRIDAVTDIVEQSRKALVAAQQFVTNGVEFGFIRMPDTGDPAHQTLPFIQSALKAIGEWERGK